MNAIPVFRDPETIRVSDLLPGDFVVEIPAQHGYRATPVNSGIRSVLWEAEFGSRQMHWYAPAPRRGGRRTYLRSRRMEFLTPSVGPYDVPAEWEIVVRRPAGRLTPEEQAERLSAAYASAETDAVGDYGRDAVDGGGWVELVRAVCDLAGPEIGETAKAEFCRTHGVEYPSGRVALGEPS